MANKTISELETEHHSLLAEKKACLQAMERDEQDHNPTKTGRCHMATIEAELARLENELRIARSK